jgi:HSP20 family protein
MKTLMLPGPMPVLRREFDRLFDDFLPMLNPENGGTWAPPVDFSETDDAFVARMDLPGMQREDITVDLEDRRLTISGERQRETEEKGENFHRVERSYGSFFRALTLPSEVKSEEIRATFDDGVLTVRIPKSEASKPRRIEITAAHNGK